MKKSYLIAAALAVGITGWMAAGYIKTPPSERDAAERPASQPAPDRMTVEVRTQSAEQVARHIMAQGQVEPNRAVTVKAETAGQVTEIVAEEGRAVTAKDNLVRIDMSDRLARLKEAQALAHERQQTYEAARTLGEKGYQTQRRIDEASSALEAARAELEQIEFEIGRTRIRAPFAGILETLHVEIGDYVAINGEIATIVDNDPLVVTVQIAQQDIGRIALGDMASVAFATGQEGFGLIRYIAPRAADATRTFRVEVEVPNPQSLIPSGTSAEARIPTGSVSAHFVSPALLTLNDAGEVGVKTVNGADRVEFHPVEIVRAEASGVWVSGLPDQAHIIAVGQGFVRDGETVLIATSAKRSGTESAHARPQ